MVLWLYVATAMISGVINANIMFYWAQNLWLSDPCIAHLSGKRRRRQRIESVILGVMTAPAWPILTPLVFFVFNRARAGVFRQRIIVVAP